MCHGAVTAKEVLSGKQGLTQAVLQPGTGPDTQVLTMCTVMLCLCPKLHRNNVGDKPVCLLVCAGSTGVCSSLWEGCGRENGSLCGHG